MESGIAVNKHILVVEDDEPSQYLMKIILEDLSFRFTIVSSGQAALDILKEETFDLVLMDIRLPLVNGYDATRIIRQEMGLTMPIVALSAHAMEWVPEKCFEAGMTDFLSKPVDFVKLQGVLAKYLKSD